MFDECPSTGLTVTSSQPGRRLGGLVVTHRSDPKVDGDPDGVREGPGDHRNHDRGRRQDHVERHHRNIGNCERDRDSHGGDHEADVEHESDGECTQLVTIDAACAAQTAADTTLTLGEP